MLPEPSTVPFSLHLGTEWQPRCYPYRKLHARL